MIHDNLVPQRSMVSRRSPHFRAVHFLSDDALMGAQMVSGYFGSRFWQI